MKRYLNSHKGSYDGLPHTPYLAKAFSTDTLLETGSEGFQRFTGLLSNQGKKYKLLFHNGSFKKKVLKYGTPKPSLCRVQAAQGLKLRVRSLRLGP